MIFQVTIEILLFLQADRDHLCMVVKIGELNLGTHDIAYKPSKLDEFGCDAVHERNYGSVIKQNRMVIAWFYFL